MIDQSLASLGHFFKAFRLGRGLSLKAAAGSLSASTLSRFERGLTDISTANARTLIQRLQLEPQDFLPLLTTNEAILPFMAQPLIERQATTELTKRWQAFQAAHPEESGLTTLAAAWYPAAIHWADPTFRLTPEAEQRLADFMIVPENVTPLEDGLRSALIGPASHELLEMLWQRSERMHHNLRKIYRGLLMIDYWLAAAANRDVAFLSAHQAEMTAELATYGQHIAYKRALPRWRFAQLLATWAQAPTPAHAQALTAYLDALANSGHRSAAAYFKTLYTRAQAAAPHHNLTLVDHFGQLVTNQHTGGVLASRLRLFGIGPEALATVRDISTLRRFIQGKTQLSFGALAQISAEVAVLPVTMLTSAGVSANGGGRPYLLYSAWYQVTDAGDAKAAQAKYAQMAKQISLLPAPLQAVQTFILQAAMAQAFQVTPTIDLTAAAGPLFAQLSQSNQWGVEEAFLVRYLAQWLPASDLPLLLSRVVKHCHLVPDDINADEYHDAIAAVLLRLTQLAPALAGRTLTAMAARPLVLDSPAGWAEQGTVIVARHQLGLAPASTVATFVQQAQVTGNYWALDKLQALWQGLVAVDTFSHPAWTQAF